MAMLCALIVCTNVSFIISTETLIFATINIITHSISLLSCNPKEFNMLFTVIALLAVSVVYGSYDCNHVDMGFNVVQPVGRCVVGRHKHNAVMSMEHQCTDDFTLETRVYQSNINCEGFEYEIVNTFDCNSNTTFVKCECGYSQQKQCALVTDIQYVKQKDGVCDQSQITDHRTYIVESHQVPKAFADANCFERKTDKQKMDVQSCTEPEAVISKTVPIWFHKLSSGESFF